MACVSCTEKSTAITVHARKTNPQNESIFIVCFFALFFILGQEHLLDTWIVSILLSTAPFTKETEPLCG